MLPPPPIKPKEIPIMTDALDKFKANLSQNIAVHCYFYHRGLLQQFYLITV
ncbi:hypothetical protein J2W48_002183 [Flavobacterium piscis]|uniref:Uncharacterized protein n=1 Tax=Flavobacterium piscis TaxID=1114874 RepID=A0ABU1Y822_9FLAO|nr:hypothetical protein [Flavobacterium piscis]